MRLELKAARSSTKKAKVSCKAHDKKAVVAKKKVNQTKAAHKHALKLKTKKIKSKKMVIVKHAKKAIKSKIKDAKKKAKKIVKAASKKLKVRLHKKKV